MVTKKRQKKDVQVTIAAGEVPTVYSNVMLVRKTPYEYVLSFALVVPPDDKEDLGDVEVLEAKPVVRVIIPNTVFPALVKIMNGLMERTQSAKSPDESNGATPEGNGT